MGVHERKIMEKEKRRNEILKAAKKVFQKVGFSNASMDMIAAKSQLSKGTLYLYFKNKDDLYVSMLLNGLVIFEEMLAKIDRQLLPTEETIIGYAITYYEFAEKYPEYFNCMVDINSGNVINLDNVSPESLEKIRNFEQRIFLDRVKTFQSAKENSIFCDNFSPCYTTAMLWTALTGAILMFRKKGRSKILDNIDPNDFIRDMAKMFIIAHSRFHKTIETYRKDILEDAYKQAPQSMFQVEHFFKRDLHSSIVNRNPQS